MIIFLD